MVRTHARGNPARRGGLGDIRFHTCGRLSDLVRPVPLDWLPPPVIRTASSGRRGRGPERRTTGVPAPLISLASRLLLLSLWSRQTGLAVVIAKGPSTKQSSLRA